MPSTKVTFGVHPNLFNLPESIHFLGLPSPESTKNCFGKLDRDKGQRRVPEPPQRMTGVTTDDLLILLMRWAIETVIVSINEVGPFYLNN